MRSICRSWAIVAVMVLSASAFSLDANDIGALVRNGIEDAIIAEMVRGNPMAVPLTAREVIMLHDSGVSSDLLRFLTSPEACGRAAIPPRPVAIASPVPAPTASPVTVNAPLTVATMCIPQVTAPVTTTYYVAPRYVYPGYVAPYYSYPYYRSYRSPVYFGVSYGARWGRPYRYHGGYRGGYRGGHRGGYRHSGRPGRLHRR